MLGLERPQQSQHTNNLPHSTNSKLQTKGIKKITKTKKQWFKTSAFKTNSDNINTTYLKHINSKIKSKEKEKEKENKKNKKQYTISSTFHNNNNKDIQFTTRKVKLKLTNSNQKKLKEWFCVLTELQNIIANDFNNTYFNNYTQHTILHYNTNSKSNSAKLLQKYREMIKTTITNYENLHGNDINFNTKYKQIPSYIIDNMIRDAVKNINSNLSKLHHQAVNKKANKKKKKKKKLR